MKELCTVKKIKRGTVFVEIERTDKCDGCKMCSFNKRKSITVPAVCDIKVDVGQKVEVEMPTAAVGGAALLIYAVPLVLMLAGVLIGLVGEWWLQLVLCASGLAVGLVCALLIDRAYRKKAGVLPRVSGIVDIDCGSAADAQPPANEQCKKNSNGDE